MAGAPFGSPGSGIAPDEGGRETLDGLLPGGRGGGDAAERPGKQLLLKKITLSLTDTDSIPAVSDTLRHAQILYSGTGIWVDGGTATRQLTVDNCLFYSLDLAFTGSVWSAKAEHLTVAYTGALAPDPDVTSFGLHVTNSIFAVLYGLERNQSPDVTTGLDGDYNGFDGSSPQFGVSDPGRFFTDSEQPFAAATGPNYIANAQARFYLRDGSPFIGVGTPLITDSLKSDLTRMTSFVPQFTSRDITSSQTFTPVVPRESGAPSLGYHYPAVDYVIDGLTVNNCTLNIDQGTVVAFTAPQYGWGIRLNPGARLNVNGHPTNRVVFAQLEAVQENPLGWKWGPLFTLKGVTLPSGTVVTPLPEARFHYADFPTLAGDATHFGPLTGDSAFDSISVLELDGCLFQGGTFNYESGSRWGRTANFHNTIFERCRVDIEDLHQQTGAQCETLTNANNLFYICDVWLLPANSGSGWTFIDNIFDQCSFHGNGPVAENHHNAYIGMANAPYPNDRLSPRAEVPGSDQILTAFSYATGPLGRFYLDTVFEPYPANPLLRDGSRTAGQAGLFHFTASTDNQTELGNQVDIGPAYVALDSTGAPLDSNADGIADFIADPEGDGNETGKIPWYSQNNTSVAILSPTDTATVSGIAQIRASPGVQPSLTSRLAILIDAGEPAFRNLEIFSPSRSTAPIDLDTTRLENGWHTLTACTYSPSQNTLGIDQIAVSQPINIFISNANRTPNWIDLAQFSINISIETSMPDYKIWFFNSAYAKAYDPAPLADPPPSGSSSGGVITYSTPLSTLGFATDGSDPAIYSITEFSDGTSSAAAVNPYISNDPPFPDVGLWAAAYGSWSVDKVVWDETVNSVTTRFSTWKIDALDPSGNRWAHDDQLYYGWLASGPFAGAGATLATPAPAGIDPTQSPVGQDWPIRDAEDRSGSLPQGFFYRDIQCLADALANPGTRNFYGYGHGTQRSFLGVWPRDNCFHRYRFVFLDGCQSYGYSLFSMFGAQLFEIEPQSIDSETSQGFVNTYPYSNTGLRPAAFMGHMVESWNSYFWPDTFQFQGKTYWRPRTLEAYANWHVQFLSIWRMPGTHYALSYAKEQADWLAWKTATGNPTTGSGWPKPPTPGSSPDPDKNPGGNLHDTDPATGQDVYWDPVHCLKITGYLYLEFNEWNHNTDWTISP